MTTAEQTPSPAEEIPPEAVADEEQQAPPETAPAGPQDDADESGDAEKPKGTRAKINALEGERDALRARLDAAHAQLFDSAVEAMGLQPALMRAAGVAVADHVQDDGTVDAAALNTAIDAKRAELGLSRRPQPNPVAGRGRENLTSPETRSLGQILKETSRPR
ncbi:hypothetical protein [Mycolicibacterium sp. S3B2]|uniref:hypothetical protein n=1 Tax=Mycolicibacterium sp. S3B2 TaxID=3415120 RepID=UPI003C7D97BF